MAVVAMGSGCFYRLQPILRYRYQRPRVRRWQVCRAKKGKSSPVQSSIPPEESESSRKSTDSNTRRNAKSETSSATSKDMSDTKNQLNTSDKKTGWSFFATKEEREAYEEALDELSDEEPPLVDLTNPSRAIDGPLPTVTRDQVINSCLSVSFNIFVMSFLLRKYAENAPDMFGNDPSTIQSLLSLTPSFSLDHVAVAIIATAIVSGARVLLYNYWTDFAIAANRSNKQVLTPLSFGDLFVVSFVPGISEELLFRGALIPALFADWRGVLISGTVFGLLHNSGGRNVAFAAWASAVGCLYGFAFLLTQDVYVPIFAHSCANLFSAMYWLSVNTDKFKEE